MRRHIETFAAATSSSLYVSGRIGALVMHDISYDAAAKFPGQHHAITSHRTPNNCGPS